MTVNILGIFFFNSCNHFIKQKFFILRNVESFISFILKETVFLDFFA